ncbi:MAG: hypothetical protein LBT96_01050 [Campylobacteraceae bacterium]|jgi:hypothetical protein|nr:hypothetical protein [Campylobacteraceae bacterium]
MAKKQKNTIQGAETNQLQNALYAKTPTEKDAEDTIDNTQNAILIITVGISAVATLIYIAFFS